MDVVYNRYTHEQTKYDRQHGATETLRKQTYQAVVYLILTDLSVLCSHNYIIYPEGPPSVRGSMVIPRMRSACDPIHELCLRWPFPLGAIFHNSYTRNYYLSHLSNCGNASRLSCFLVKALTTVQGVSLQEARTVNK